jgi:hypothetical protein
METFNFKNMNNVDVRRTAIIIFISKSAPAFLRRFCNILVFPAMYRESDHQVFTYLDFTTIIFYRAR